MKKNYGATREKPIHLTPKKRYAAIPVSDEYMAALTAQPLVRFARLVAPPSRKKKKDRNSG